MKRKYFGTDGIRGRSNQSPMTAELALRLGRALVRFFQNETMEPVSIAIGKDTRLSGYLFESALSAGITSAGGEVILLGPLPTPAVAYHVVQQSANGGVMISASHNPYYDNGLKVFRSDGFKLSDEEELRIETLMDEEHKGGESVGKVRRLKEARDEYIDSLFRGVASSLEGFDIPMVFDAANGAGYDCGREIFRRMSSNLTTLACDPNGMNINEDCAQQQPSLLAKAVRDADAKLGIALDGDADRLVVMDENGVMLAGEHLFYAIATFLKEKGRLHKNQVVTTVMANRSLEVALKKKGIQCSRVGVGDRYVTEKLIQEELSFGGETSGHYLFLDQNTTADGLFTALEVLALLCEKGMLVSDLHKSFSLLPHKLVNVLVSEKRQVEEMPRLQNAMAAIEERYCEQGRVFVRYSGTECLMRLMIEGPDHESVERDSNELKKIVQEEIGQ